MRRCFFYLVCGLLPFFEQQIVSHPIATVETLLRVPPQEFQNYQHLVAEYPATRVALDQWLLRHECHEEAMLEYADPDQDLSHVTLPLDLCRCWYHLKRYLDVVEHCQDFPHLMALTYHYLQQYHEASSWYRLAESLHPDVAQLHYDYAVTLDRQGLIHQACARYNTALALDASLAYVWLNLAALHQRFGDIKTAIKLYHEALRRVTGTSQRPTTQARMISTNLAIAYEQVGQFDLAFHWYGQSLGRNENHHDSQLGAEEILSLRAHEYRAAQKIGSWEHHEAWQVELIVATRRQCQEGARGRATVLPYDAMKFGPAFRPLDAKRLAERYAQELESSTFFRNHDDYVFKNDPTHKLVIGYLSHDFYDHITLELMEGLFVYHNIDALDVHAFNYGKENHNSSLCQRIERDTGVVFHNVVSLGNEEIAVAIQETGVQILLDAQAFTMGSRDEIMATKPSPITVSYLVYPGTMGAPYIDYVIVDRHVAQVETSMDQFTEKLVVLPDCYQVNYYEHLLNPHRKDDERMDHEEGRSAFGIPSSERRDWDLPPNVFVFANLNKNDKIDPSVFALWMRILRQVPQSVLWLLQPSFPDQFESLRHNLEREAERHGILSQRILFASRVKKAQHLERQRHADIFLDTIGYGAHSTATDALRAGLPIITLMNEGFQSRVAGSLLHNVYMPWMISCSMKDYERLAVDLALAPSLCTRIRRFLHDQIPTAPLFQTKTYTRALENVYHHMWELWAQDQTPKHLIVLP